MKILDATAGFRGIWYQKNHPFVTFMDKREKQMLESNHPIGKKRRFKINPDVVSEWKDAPFPDNHFDMIIFDPPHLIWKREKKESSLDKEYGYFYENTWKQEMQEGINKLFQILKPEGIFIFKWCEQKINVNDVLKLFPYKPLFGSNTKSKGHTANYWIVFIKHKLEQELEIR